MHPSHNMRVKEAHQRLEAELQELEALVQCLKSIDGTKRVGDLDEDIRDDLEYFLE